ncbi:MAG: hydrogen peroxide-inducible genes activator [Reyranella sp.]|jgi:LysR family hydrogen peroxide-inducible transcriptional activator|nr:MAG: hydrogen peroxide-inducible genes activator [Reyranella sp.]
MRPTPTLRQLRYLVATVDRCHFGQAAAACNVSQSTLSAGIQELEELLGAPMLERTKRTVVPTALGRELADRARLLLQGAEELMEVAQAARDPMSGSVHLGVIPTIGPFLLPRALPRLREAWPKLQLYLREDQTARLLERLDSGELDAALLALPYPMGDLEVMDLGEDLFSVVYPTGREAPKDMASENLLLLEDGHCLRDQALAACELESARRNTAYNGTSLHTLAQMVANGLGVTLMPQMALDAGIVRGLDVAVRPLTGASPHRRIGLVWRRASARKETFRRLGEMLKKELAG